MGNKRKGISDRITEGKEIGREAIEAGEKLESDGREIRSIMDGIEVADEEDSAAIQEAQSGYAADFKSEFSDTSAAKGQEAKAIEESATDEATEAQEQNEDAESKLKEMSSVTEVGRENAESASERIREGISEYEEQILEASEVINETQSEIERLSGSIDSIFG